MSQPIKAAGIAELGLGTKLVIGPSYYIITDITDLTKEEITIKLTKTDV